MLLLRMEYSLIIPYNYAYYSSLLIEDFTNSGDNKALCCSVFFLFTPCSDNLRVEITDGSLTIVSRKGSIKITENITLTSVLYVPNLSCNLLSISKLTKDFNCIAKFSSSCEFKELYSRKKIGSAKVHEGLYFFGDEDSRTRQALVFGFEFIYFFYDKIMLWHHRLDHPSFPYLKSLFSYLFKNKDPCSFQCENFQIAKHTRVPFPIIHSDIW